MTALVGRSGDKSFGKTAVHFYSGFRTAGASRWAGQDLTDVRIRHSTTRSYVSQEQFLFNTSLYENILIGRPDASREDVIEAARRAQCDEFLARFPQGIDTPAGDGGKMLSGGERGSAYPLRAPC